VPAAQRPMSRLRWPSVRSSAFRARPGGVRQIFLILFTSGVVVVLEAVARPGREAGTCSGKREGLEGGGGGEKELEAGVGEGVEGEEAMVFFLGGWGGLGGGG